MHDPRDAPVPVGATDLPPNFILLSKGGSDASLFHFSVAGSTSHGLSLMVSIQAR